MTDRAAGARYFEPPSSLSLAIFRPSKNGNPMIIDVAQRWFQAFNAHDLEGLLALYADDARHFSPKLHVRKPETGGWVQGKDALRAWWRDSFQRLPSLRYEPTNFIANGTAVFMEYIRHVEGEADLRVGEVLEVADGLITASRVYHG